MFIGAASLRRPGRRQATAESCIVTGFIPWGSPMTATDSRSQAPRTVGLSVLLASGALGAVLLVAGAPARAQGIPAAAAQVPFQQGRHVLDGVNEVPLSAYSQLLWRLAAPFRGGWATMAAGVSGSPDTFYFSGAGGGIWKTSDA